MGSTTMNKMMIDIETLGTGPDASILSIGACIFTLNGGIGATFEVNLKPDGRMIDPETVRWWLQQSKAAQNKLFDPEPMDPKTARLGLTRFIETFRPREFWANGALFDLNILRDFYNDYPPWKYNQEMCMRSIRSLGKSIGLSYGQWWANNNQDNVQHGALDDAIRQAKYVIDVFNRAIHGKK